MKRVLGRLRAQDGFGIIELSIAMVLLNIGILAIVAAFNSGAVALARSSKIANATVIADTYLERYRGYRNCQIYLDTSGNANGGLSAAQANSTYTSDPAYTGSPTSKIVTDTYPATGQIQASCTQAFTAWSCPASGAYTGSLTGVQFAVTAHNPCYLGPDNRQYVVDVYIVDVDVTNGGNQKQVTVVVRDPSTNSQLVRESSTFDPFDAP